MNEVILDSNIAWHNDESQINPKNRSNLTDSTRLHGFDIE